MPVSLKKIKDTGALVLLKKCEVCGEDAYFGFDVKFNRALIVLDKGKKELAKELLGRWYCYEHRKEG